MPTQRERAERIRDKARELFRRPHVGDCESLAQLVEWAQSEFHNDYFGLNNDEESFVEDFGLALTNVSECGFDRTEDIDLYAGYGFAGDTCFKMIFRDRSNQVRHFWGYVLAGFQYGRMLGAIATVREGGEEADCELGEDGARLGAGLDALGVALDEVADWIRTNLCSRGNCFATAPNGDEEDEEEEDTEGALNSRDDMIAPVTSSTVVSKRPVRSSGQRFRKALGSFLVNFGLADLWHAVELYNGRIVDRRMRTYGERLATESGAPVSARHFPFSYFAKRLATGMIEEQVDGIVTAPEARKRITAPLARGNYAIIYTFRFGFLRRQRLIVIFDAAGRLVGLDEEGLTRDVRS